MKSASMLIFWMNSIVGLFFVTSCHFGDENDQFDKIASTKRALSYSVTLALPDTIDDNLLVKDNGQEGLSIGFGDDIEIAVLGKEFQVEKDTTGEALWPSVTVLRHQTYKDGQPICENGFSKLNFAFSGHAMHGHGDDYATDVRFLYPAHFTRDTENQYLKARVDSISFDFTGQNGTLEDLRDNYYCALGMAKAICNQTSVVMRDNANCVAGHDHSATAADFVTLDSKVAVLRIALVVPAQQNYTLLQYLKMQNMSGKKYYIDHIEINNLAAEAPAISKANLILENGRMRSQQGALSSLTITDEKYWFWDHKEIPQDESEPIEYQNGFLMTWGTLLYVAVPCVTDGTIQFEPEIEVCVKDLSVTPIETIIYQGRLESFVLHEGEYHVTSPVLLRKK